MERSRAQVLVQVNQALVLTYWHIGQTIKQTVITEARADYGDATMQKLADRLVLDYGPGFGRAATCFAWSSSTSALTAWRL